MPEEVRLTTVYIAVGQPEAQIIKGRLESEGIPAVLRYESAGIVYGITVDGLGQVEIQVPAFLAEEARQILGVEKK
jgi:Zn-dependent alcohol dehydrogenase